MRDDGAASTSPRPASAPTSPRSAPREVQRLTADFNRMLARLEQERREAGRAVLRAQEQERARIAQDLHDEVNQALTAILLRLAGDDRSTRRPALRAELQGDQALATQAMEELLHARPPAAPDRARRPRPRRPRSPRRSPTSASAPASARTSTATATVPELSDEEQLVIYRVTQESLSNVVQHSGARRVDVELSFVGRTVLRVRDDGCGFAAASQRPQRPPRRLRHARARAAGRRPPERLLRARRGHDHRTDHGSDMRILIADDHGIVRGGLKLLIERQPDMEVVAEAERRRRGLRAGAAPRSPTCACWTSRCRA